MIVLSKYECECGFKDELVCSDDTPEEYILKALKKEQICYNCHKTYKFSKQERYVD